MKKIMFVLAVVVLALGVSGSAMAQESPTAAPEVTDLEKVVAYTQPSVVYLDIQWVGWVYDRYNDTYLNDGDPFVLNYSCTGFFVNPDGHVATAGHCVDKLDITSAFFDTAAAWALEDRYYASNRLTYEDIRGFADEDYRLEGEKEGSGGGNFTPGADMTLQAVWSTESTEELYDNDFNLNGEVHDARLVKLIRWNNGEGDTALVKVETNEPVIPLPLTPDEVDTGLAVTSIGYPASVGDVSDTALSDPSFKEGSVSSVRSNATYPVYEMSASMSGGMSGGPTVDNQGRVVGVNSFGINGEASEFEFVQASSTLEQLMIDAGVTSELGEIGEAYRAGLDALFAGNKRQAVSNLTIAADDVPMAEDYLTQAQALPNPAPPESGFPVLPVGLGLGVLLLGGIAAFLVIRKRQPRSAGPVPSGDDDAKSEVSLPPPPATESVETEPLALVTAEPTKPVKQQSFISTCRNCQREIPRNASYCPHCGVEQNVHAV